MVFGALVRVGVRDVRVSQTPQGVRQGSRGGDISLDPFTTGFPGCPSPVQRRNLIPLKCKVTAQFLTDVARTAHNKDLLPHNIPFSFGAEFTFLSNENKNINYG